MMPLATTPLMTLERVAELSEGRLIAAGGAAAAVDGVSIDTRTLATGDLFVPLPGRRRDGHEFIAEAFARGAAAALCDRERLAAGAPGAAGPLVAVDDVTAALQRLARGHRRGWRGLLVGITGSSGKTTTKDLVAVVLGTGGPTLKTEGNRNNHWGVPLTLLGLRAEHWAAAVEMGTNHPGEIAALAEITGPDAGVITNVGHAHLEHFGTLEAVAREKAALAYALAPGRPLFAGAQSPELLRALAGAPCRVVTYGLAPAAEVRASAIDDLGPEGTRIEVPGFPAFRLAVPGRHQALNALAALAVARELKLDPAAAARALEGYRTASGRMEVKRSRGASLLVDCYNANPESTRAALETLAAWPRATRRVAVLGDMLELGDRASALHRATGAAARGAELWVVGDYAADYQAGAAEAGIEARRFPDRRAVALALREILEPGTVVLLKASRGAALEQVLEGLEMEGE